MSLANNPRVLSSAMFADRVIETMVAQYATDEHTMAHWATQQFYGICHAIEHATTVHLLELTSHYTDARDREREIRRTLNHFQHFTMTLDLYRQFQARERGIHSVYLWVPGTHLKERIALVRHIDTSRYNGASPVPAHLLPATSEER